MQTELITLSAPEYWAPALINGDWSGLNAEQAAQARDFLVGEGIASVETCEEGGFMWRARRHMCRLPLPRVCRLADST
jgi:hypothetical protein